MGFDRFDPRTCYALYAPDPSSVGQSFMVGVMQRSDISRRASAASASGPVTGFPARFQKELAVNISVLRRKRKPVTMQAAPRSGRERMGKCRRKGMADSGVRSLSLFAKLVAKVPFCAQLSGLIVLSQSTCAAHKLIFLSAFCSHHLANPGALAALPVWPSSQQLRVDYIRYSLNLAFSLSRLVTVHTP